MTKESLELGKKGEELAAGLLKENRYRILFRNYKTKLGEIDIIARDRDTICFVEVKTRNSSHFGLPEEAVSKSKQRQISKAALQFISEKNLFGRRARFDVVSVVLSEEEPRLNLIKDAFNLAEGFSY